MKATKRSANGTSFFNETIRMSVNDARKILGEPKYENNTGEDKVNFTWVMETYSGDVFTVYDYKEYRVLDENEMIEWHIGGDDELITEEALNEMASALE